MNKDKTFGIIGVCGANGNLIARILKQRGYNVIGTDVAFKKDCRFAKSLDGYDIDVFYGKTPDTFFKKADYVIPPASLPKDADVIKRCTKPILELNDVIENIKADKDVFGITGTNGKTTSTTLLKKIAYDNGIKPSEHGLEGMQGNAEFIPILQSRLEGDVGILEVGTFGVPGTVGRIVKNTSMKGGLITNITPDHLNDLGSFIDYANVKGEFISELNEGTLIVNGHDPTIMGLIRELDFKGDVITFGVDETPQSVGTKECVCGREINVKEIISGCGYYFCKCGLTTPQVDYIATNVDLKNRTFDLHTPDEKLEVKMSIDGLHNVYNIVGVIIAAHKFLKLPYEKILPTCVITVSSESGHIGDSNIFESVLKFSKFVVPASSASKKIAIEFLDENPSLTDRIFFNNIGNFKKTGTIGASKEEFMDGLKIALNLDCEMVISIGEACVKYKSIIHNL